jgi:anti-sigma factor RsiW
MKKRGMSMNKKILKLLYRSFDVDLSEKERKQLEEALEGSTELQREKEQIAAQRQAVSVSTAQSFKPFFAERVISRIRAKAEEENTLEVFYQTLKAVFRRLAFAAAVIMIALITINLIIGESLPTDKAFYISELTFEQVLQLPLF